VCGGGTVEGEDNQNIILVGGGLTHPGQKPDQGVTWTSDWCPIWVGQGWLRHAISLLWHFWAQIMSSYQDASVILPQRK
jgi:hypothetical protein